MWSLLAVITYADIVKSRFRIDHFRRLDMKLNYIRATGVVYARQCLPSRLHSNVAGTELGMILHIWFNINSNMTAIAPASAGNFFLRGRGGSESKWFHFCSHFVPYEIKRDGASSTHRRRSQLSAPSLSQKPAQVKYWSLLCTKVNMLTFKDQSSLSK